MAFWDSIKSKRFGSRDRHRKADSYFRFASEAAEEGLWYIDLFKKVIYTNYVFECLLGYSADEMQLRMLSWRGLWPLVHKHERRQVYTEILHLLHERQHSVSLDCRVICADSSWRWVHIRARCVHSGKRSMSMKIAGSISDISRRKEYEIDLIESKRKLNTLINNIPGIVFRCALDIDWTMEFLSTNCEDICGYAPDDFISNKIRTFASIIDVADRERVFDEINSALRDGKPGYQVSYRIKHADGGVVWVQENGMAVVDENGQCCALEGVISDVTAQKKTEFELKEQMARAERASLAKTTFLASMSHELRTPLNGIFGFCQMLRQSGSLSLEQGAYVNVIEKSSNRLIDTIDNIFDVVVIETGNVSALKEPVDLDKFFDRLFVLFSQKKMELKKNAVVFEVNKNNWAEAVTIETDVSLLERVFRHLLENALKFTSRGRIEFGYKLLKDGTVDFFVQDTGIGIPQAKINEVFDLFTQADEGLARRYEGTGTGLYIAKSFVDLLGGHLKCTSQENFGTEVLFNLPSGDISRQGVVGVPHDVPRQNAHILVVEDDIDSIDYYSKLLTKNSYKVLHASNGEEAVNIFRTHSEIDFVLMDLHLPKVDGFEALQNIRQIRPDVPVVAQTAFAIEENRQKCLKSGFDDYVAKPVSITVLQELLAKHLWKKVNRSPKEEA